MPTEYNNDYSSCSEKEETFGNFSRPSLDLTEEVDKSVASVCILCKANPRATDKHCRSCRDSLNKKARQKRQERNRRGICVDCPRRVTKKHNGKPGVRCQICAIKHSDNENRRYRKSKS